MHAGIMAFDCLYVFKPSCWSLTAAPERWLSLHCSKIRWPPHPCTCCNPDVPRTPTRAFTSAGLFGGVGGVIGSGSVRGVSPGAGGVNNAGAIGRFAPSPPSAGGLFSAQQQHVIHFFSHGYLHISLLIQQFWRIIYAIPPQM